MSIQMQGEIAQLNSELEQSDDPRECYAKVQAKIRKYRQDGIKIPDDLALIEKRLVAECMAASQGRSPPPTAISKTRSTKSSPASATSRAR